MHALSEEEAGSSLEQRFVSHVLPALRGISLRQLPESEDQANSELGGSKECFT